jgi:hypothetical protein
MAMNAILLTSKTPQELSDSEFSELAKSMFIFLKEIKESHWVSDFLVSCLQGIISFSQGKFLNH